MLVNKLIALLPNPRRKLFHLRRIAFRRIRPVPVWAVDWFFDPLGRVHGRRQGRPLRFLEWIPD
jgi:hypothetical protein